LSGKQTHCAQLEAQTDAFREDKLNTINYALGENNERQSAISIKTDKPKKRNK